MNSAYEHMHIDCKYFRATRLEVSLLLFALYISCNLFGHPESLSPMPFWFWLDACYFLADQHYRSEFYVSDLQIEGRIHQISQLCLHDNMTVI